MVKKKKKSVKEEEIREIIKKGNFLASEWASMKGLDYFLFKYWDKQGTINENEFNILKEKIFNREENNAKKMTIQQKGGKL